MKKIIIIMLMLLGINSFSYDFPLKDPYIATVFGSSTLMTQGVIEKIPLKLYRTELISTREIPENLEYQKGYKFSVALQKKKAPLVFILSGTSSSSTSLKTQYFQRIFYTAGYHVVGISSITNTNSLVALSYEKIPGNLMNDGMDIYRGLQYIKNLVEKKAQVEDYSIMGYSLGGTHSAIISFIDSKEKVFNFNKVFMLNPAVNLYESATILDNMFVEGTDNNVDNFFIKVNSLMGLLSSYRDGFKDISGNPYEVLKALNVTEKDLKMGIGLVFRLNSIDINFLTDYVNDMKVYSEGKIEKYENMGKYFEKINFANFQDYIDRIALPYYQQHYKKNLTKKELSKFTDLKMIEDYLKTAKNIRCVTNKDEIILTKKHFDFLKKTFGKNLYIYPYGGHCGNMFYQENVDYMLKFMKEGR